MFKENANTKKCNIAGSEDIISFNPANFKNSRMTVKQAMECFDVCRTTILNWERRNILIPQRIGRRVYYILNQNQLLR